ncbi:ParB/RepB/Spo0J family partition protein [Candidatus Nomurabacteria bacterium]|nr:ParB/RepB/Spo0J family partition protein [Candidatus Kaiserbacteria bacterium]MCB9814756.1 ParB/RepB/Spo0J family partition protein [Candidatus Nomurabacteria bacterium]
MAFQGDSIYWVEVEKVVPNPFQPRREFDQHKLQELADSIRMYGVLQPLTVTRNEIHRDDGTFYSEYELIAGERRLRASKLAGVAQVPVIIRDGEQNEQEKLELAIIENLQREDLNAVDRALAFQQLADVFKLSHVQVAQKMGRSREYVSNSIRLLALPEHILTSLKRGELSEGHARTLLMLTDRPEEQEVIFREILLKKLSVREVERIVRKIATDKVRKKSGDDIDAHLIEFEKQFTETLGTRVQIQKTDFGGKLTIDYFSNEDLEVILKRMRDEGTGAKMVSHQEMAQRLSDHTPLSVVATATAVSENLASDTVFPAPDFASYNSPTENPVSNRSEADSPKEEPSQVVNQPESIHNYSKFSQSETVAPEKTEEPKVTYGTPVQNTPEVTEKPAESFVYNPPTQIVSPVAPVQPTQSNEVVQATQVESEKAEPEKTHLPWYEKILNHNEAPAEKNEATESDSQNIQAQQNPSANPEEKPPYVASVNNQYSNQGGFIDRNPSQSNVDRQETLQSQPAAPKAPESDDSNLYSINNFTV